MTGSRSDDCTETVEKEATSSVDALGKKVTSTEWTDEKHSLYLESMEASFVDQLYNSMDSFGGRWRKGHESAAGSSKCMNPHMTDQFKVHQNGSWQKLNFGRDETLPGADERHHLVANPWIRHFRSGHRQDVPFMTEQQSVASGSQPWSYGMKEELSHGSVDISKPFSPCSTHRDSVYSNEEASGQNFIDEEDEADDSAHCFKDRPRLKFPCR
ncbi:hypothetical protein Dimus_027979 [Dionaea muscipula]